MPLSAPTFIILAAFDSLIFVSGHRSRICIAKAFVGLISVSVQHETAVRNTTASEDSGNTKTPALVLYNDGDAAMLCWTQHPVV